MKLLSQKLFISSALNLLLVSLIIIAMMFYYYYDQRRKIISKYKSDIAGTVKENIGIFASNSLLKQSKANQMLIENIKKRYGYTSVNWICGENVKNKLIKTSEDQYVYEEKIILPDGGNCVLIVVSGNAFKKINSQLWNNLLILAAVASFLLLTVIFTVSNIIKKYFYIPLSTVCNYIDSISNGNSPLKNLKFNSDLDLVIDKLFGLDISIKKNTKKIEEDSKYVAIGQTAALLAHDVKKPFTQLHALLEILDSVKNKPEALADMKNEVKRSIKNVDTMVNDIMDFSREAGLECSPCSVASVIDYAVKLTSQSYIKYDINLEYSVNNTFKFLVNEERILRVFVNIISNGIEAITQMAKRKSGTIKFYTYSIDENNIKYVEIRISNNGPVFNEEDIPNIFSSFFTKGKSKGTGLGLASAKKIVELHQGSIYAYNEKDGVVFVIKIPASEEKDFINCVFPKNIKEANVIDFKIGQTYLENIIDTLARSGKEYKTILIDDEALYRASVRNLVRQNDPISKIMTLYEVQNVDDAVMLVKNEHIEYAIVDIDLNDAKNGFDFLKEVQRAFPQIKCLVHSNRCFDEEKSKARKLGALGFVPKPLRLDSLVLFLSGTNLFDYSQNDNYHDQQNIT